MVAQASANERVVGRLRRVGDQLPFLNAPMFRRTIRLIVTFVLVTFLTSLMLDLLPGDPAVAIAGADTFTEITPERLDAIREEFGLNDPIAVRYWDWLSGLFAGDFGTSYRIRAPVTELIFPRLPVTLEVMALAQLLALAFALLFAPFAALFRGRPFDRSVSFVSFALVSIPTFISAIVLIRLLAVQIHAFPSTGYVPISDGIFANLKSVTLPAFALAAAQAGIYARVLRSGMVASLEEDYSLMARAKGLANRIILTRHALRPASLPLLTLVGLSTAAMIGGAVITETIFALPGIGQLMIDSIYARDIVTVQGIVALVAGSYVVINYLVDLAYLIADPRIRHGHS